MRISSCRASSGSRTGGGSSRSGVADVAPAVIPPLPVKTQVGMNLEYCELCEMKLSPNPIEERFLWFSIILL